MPNLSTNLELLDVINEDVKSLKEWTNMPPISDELYNNFYNPKDKVAQTNVDLSALYDIKTEKDLSEKITQDMVNASLNTPMWYEKNSD